MQIAQISVDWQERKGRVSMFTMDGILLANSRDSGKGKVYEEIARRCNAYPDLLATFQHLLDMMHPHLIDTQGDMGADLADAMIQARAAIEKATKGT